MKELNSIDLALEKEKIETLLQSLKITNYKIDDNLVVDVFESVNLYGKNLKKIPVQFGIVKGNFLCGMNNLTSLKGAPSIVTGGFSCADNKLITLEDGPMTVLKEYYCMGNELVSLKGSPKKVKAFNCAHNKLTTLEFGPTEIEKEYVCSNNQLTNLMYSPKVIPEFFYCNHNYLTTLVGGPEIVGMRYQCSKNELTNIVGVAHEVGEFDCSSNPITSLKGLPSKLKGKLDISNTLLKEIDVDVEFGDGLVHLVLENQPKLVGFESLYEVVHSDEEKFLELDIDYKVFNAIQTVLKEKKQLESIIENLNIPSKKLKI